MTREAAETILKAFFDRFKTRDVEGILDTLTDDVTWWVAGKPDRLPGAGIKNKKQVEKMLRALLSRMKGGLAFTIKGLLVDGDTVAVELEGYGELDNGRIYNNEYHTVMRLRGDKIADVREYLDTLHVHATFFEP